MNAGIVRQQKEYGIPGYAFRKWNRCPPPTKNKKLPPKINHMQGEKEPEYVDLKVVSEIFGINYGRAIQWLSDMNLSNYRMTRWGAKYYFTQNDLLSFAEHELLDEKNPRYSQEDADEIKNRIEAGFKGNDSLLQILPTFAQLNGWKRLIDASNREFFRFAKKYSIKEYELIREYFMEDKTLSEIAENYKASIPTVSSYIRSGMRNTQKGIESEGLSFQDILNVLDPSSNERRENISSLQNQILKFLSDFEDAHGAFPTLKTIQEQFDMSNPSAAAYHLNILEKKGYLLRASDAPKKRTVNQARI